MVSFSTVSLNIIFPIDYVVSLKVQPNSISVERKPMDYAVIADSYEKIEATTKRLEMTDLLVELLKKTPKDIISRVVYLTQGKLYPDFMGIEMGVAEKLA